MTTYFISDLHLDETRPAISRAFFDFLDHKARGADALYILGDFFEVWVGDDDDSAYSREVVARLRAFSDSGTPLFFMHGNRDFLLGEQFCRETGAALLTDPTVIDLYGQRVLLMHGDSLCTRDTEYMAFRQQARSREWQQGLLSQPLEARRAFAQNARQQSKTMNSLKAEDIMDVTPSEVVAALESHKAQIMIHGHTHRPNCHEFEANHQPAQRWVLGDWGDYSWWFEASADGTLVQHKALINR